MNRIMGAILIIIGIIFFVVGVVVYNSSSKQNERKSTKSKISKQNETKNEIDSKTSKGNELDKAIEMAIADGIITDNERKLIKKIATEQGLDYNEIIKNAEKELSESKFDAETELIDYKKKKGDDFEKYIVQKFNRKFFHIKEWAGDKYVKGIYAETTPQPDLLLECHLNQNRYLFAVECKWRQKLFKGGVEIANEYQFNRYKTYEKTKNIPVFIAIGIGGKADYPENLYIIPLRLLETNFIIFKELKKYEKDIDEHFYYDIKTKELR